jgi:transcriptional regulator with XRE-family HTH domain
MVTNFTIKNSQKIKDQIALSGRSIKQFSKDIGISNPYVTNVINGKRTAGVITAKKIADNLNEEIGDIFFTASVLKKVTEGKETTK